MSGLVSRFSLPLLLKELIEQSAKRRLFVTRVVFAVLLFLMSAAFMMPLIHRQQMTPIGMLGIGKQLFQMLLMLQFAGIYLFLPALACGVITVEKERNTLALLFLTRLSPWTIVVEKFGSRMVPMLSLLLTSLPLLAFTSSLGGIRTFDLASGVWFLMLCVMQVASAAILASAFFRSTVAAFLATYVILSVEGFGIAAVDGLFLKGALLDWWAVFGNVHLQWLLGPDAVRLGYLVRLIFFPLGLVGHLSSMSGIGQSPHAYLILVLLGIPSVLSALVCLGLAKICLVPRAFLAPANPLLNFFKLLDRLFVWANKRFTRDIVLVNDSQTLPRMRPVAWRETAKRSLGQFRYLVRILIVLEFPVLFVVCLAALEGARTDMRTDPISALLGTVWVVVVLIVSTSASTLFSRERGRQTLDVLLTSPLTSREIVLEKLSGVQRLVMVCALPLLTCVFFETWWRDQMQYGGMDRQWVLGLTGGYRTQLYVWPEYLAGGVLTIFIYLNLVAWLSLWLGIRTASPARAIFSSLAAIVIWCVVPAVVVGLALDYLFVSPDQMRDLSLQWAMLTLLSSPLVLIGMMEMEGVYRLHPMPLLAVGINSVVYGGCWYLIRRQVLQQADRYLGRIRTHEPVAESLTDSIEICDSATAPAGAPVTI